MEYEAVCCTNRGTRKEVNQDSACAMVADTADGQVCMALLCDGMGGIALGEYASFTVIASFVDWFEHALPCRIREGLDLETVGGEWQGMLSDLDAQLRDYGKGRGIKLGTTATCMLFWKRRYLLVQSGDSRAYRLDKRVTQISEDQSYVQRQINSGLMTTQEARRHPKRNILTGCIGGSRPSTPVCSYGKQPSEARYLLCSDGFAHELEEEEIWRTLVGSRESIGRLKGNMDMLIQKAMERGETDNITAVVVSAERRNGMGKRLRGNAQEAEFAIKQKIIVTEGSRLAVGMLPATEE